MSEVKVQIGELGPEKNWLMPGNSSMKTIAPALVHKLSRQQVLALHMTELGAAQGDSMKPPTPRNPPPLSPPCTPPPRGQPRFDEAKQQSK